MLAAHPPRAHGARRRVHLVQINLTRILAAKTLLTREAMPSAQRVRRQLALVSRLLPRRLTIKEAILLIARYQTPKKNLKLKRSNDPNQRVPSTSFVLVALLSLMTIRTARIPRMLKNRLLVEGCKAAIRPVVKLLHLGYHHLLNKQSRRL